MKNEIRFHALDFFQFSLWFYYQLLEWNGSEALSDHGELYNKLLIDRILNNNWTAKLHEKYNKYYAQMQ